VTSLQEFAASLKTRAHALGFDACGIAPASRFPELDRFAAWLQRGYAGTMSFLERSAEQRADVRRALASAQSVVATATLYNTDRPYSIESRDPARAYISRYAWGDDYHGVIMRRLDTLVAWMHEAWPEPFEAAPYVDTGPVQERAFAQRAGIGWIGKNCCVINRELGSFVFLAEVLCSLPLPADPPGFDQCGSCSLCLEACPTQALVEPGVLDARRCISYLTIEHRGPVDGELAELTGTHVYGCDICQEVCPYNAIVPTSEDPAWLPRPVWDRPSVDDLVEMDDETLRRGLAGSAMTRARKAGLRANFERAHANAEKTRAARR
jgi:epoxyqueuosine reductase